MNWLFRQRVSHQSAAGAPDLADDYAHRLLAETREEIVRADGKASILFAASGVVAGVVLSGLMSGDWTPLALRGIVAQGAWWLGAALGAASVGLLGLAVYPRLWRAEDKEEVNYFAQIAAYSNEDELNAAIEKAALRGRRRTVNQVWVLSRIVRGKYRLLRWALRGLALAGALWIASVVFSAANVCWCD